MPRTLRIKERADGWSDWLMPVMAKYHMGCCDCGLVHTLQFRIFRVAKKAGQFSEGPDVSRSHRVLFRAQRNNRSTAAIRRSKKEVISMSKSKPKTKPKTKPMKPKW